MTGTRAVEVVLATVLWAAVVWGVYVLVWEAREARRRRREKTLYVALHADKSKPGEQVTFPAGADSHPIVYGGGIPALGLLMWSCMVCGKMRPDDEIAVASSTWEMGGFPLQVNVRYCADDPACKAAAVERAAADGERMSGDGDHDLMAGEVSVIEIDGGGDRPGFIPGALVEQLIARGPEACPYCQAWPSVPCPLH
jgi:hypothetical protein